MQSAIKVGLDPSGDVIKWTDSPGVAFQAVLVIVSCTSVSSKAFVSFFMHFSVLVANYHSPPVPHCVGTAIIRTSWVLKKKALEESKCMWTNDPVTKCTSSAGPLADPWDKKTFQH